ncbi:unnamed protein product [Amoebophrya sp. A120]|nr:unnamed protein product [Amoebophrya sp. A120]|eukprot:GSA120T00018822001.1
MDNMSTRAPPTLQEVMPQKLSSCYCATSTLPKQYPPTGVLADASDRFSQNVWQTFYCETCGLPLPRDPLEAKKESEVLDYMVREALVKALEEIKIVSGKKDDTMLKLKFYQQLQKLDEPSDESKLAMEKALQRYKQPPKPITLT